MIFQVLGQRSSVELAPRYAQVRRELFSGIEHPVGDGDRRLHRREYNRSHTHACHHHYHHLRLPEVLNLQPYGGEAKPYQIGQVLSLVESYNLNLEDKR